jgi:hypothetical protein
MRKLFKKIQCLFGYHAFTSSIQDYIDEFGYVPLDGRICANAKCSECGVKYKNGKHEN